MRLERLAATLLVCAAAAACVPWYDPPSDLMRAAECVRDVYSATPGVTNARVESIWFRPVVRYDYVLSSGATINVGYSIVRRSPEPLLPLAFVGRSEWGDDNRPAWPRDWLTIRSKCGVEMLVRETT